MVGSVRLRRRKYFEIRRIGRIQTDSKSVRYLKRADQVFATKALRLPTLKCGLLERVSCSREDVNQSLFKQG
jgi:hypothetical protein